MAASDEELVATVQAGDASAFDELVLRWETRIRGAAYRVLGSEEEAYDVVQEALLKAYRGLPGFKREARFSSWLYQIALNLCRDRLRRRRGRQQVSLDELPEAVASGGRGRGGPSALELVESSDLRRRVAAAVAALPDEQREVIVLKEYEGLTFVEIAHVLELPVSTVKTRLYRGLGQLRTSLERVGVHGTPVATTPGREA
jgi:RNA polymerase sigma-70 factor (ECF subfamily)